LKITIPKDASKPDGDAVENGALLSASELQKRGHFVNSPSDEVPVPVDQHSTKKDNVAKDKMYRPPKRSNDLDNEAPRFIYGSDGEELTSETECGHKLVSTNQ